MTILFEILLYVARALLGLVAYWLLYPVVLLICTPFILVAGAFGKQPWRYAVSDGYDRVIYFWNKWGFMFAS